LTRRPFPFGIQPEVSDPGSDERGFDSMNRLLLHGTRYHHRRAVFVSHELGETPDWRADRLSIRIGLALREDLSVGPGDVVALFMPLSISWALVERAVWGLGAATLPVSSESGFGRPVKAVFASSAEGLSDLGVPVVALDSDWAALLDRGGVLDTPERASSFRTGARNTPPDAVCTIESGVELRHREWVRRIESFLERFPPERGARHVLDFSQPHFAARALLYAGWADGFTTVVLGGDDLDGGSTCRRFANLAELEGLEGMSHG
jgi:acyl-CoA synthetase (AMP-forming)/AMP-acid ligase II